MFTYMYMIATEKKTEVYQLINYQHKISSKFFNEKSLCKK